MKSIRTASSFALSFVFVLISLTAKAETRTTWAGMYMGDKKMGYTRLTTASATYQGKPATSVESYTRVELEVLGNSVGQTIESTTYTSAAGKLLHQFFKISSGFADMVVKADYTPEKVVCSLTSDENTNTKTLKIPPGATIVSDSTTGGLISKLRGAGADFLYLNPLTLSLEKLHVAMKGKEVVTLGGKEFTALRVHSTTPMGSFTSWETETGGLLKAEMPLGMVMVREEPAIAQNLSSTQPEFKVVGTATAVAATVSPTYKPPSDFALATALTVEKPIENPREITALSMKVSGISDKERAISDSRQRALAIPEEMGAYFYSVRAEKFDAETAVSLPISDSALAPYLQSGPYLDIGDSGIKETAAKIRGEERNSYKVAQAIRKWIHDAMKPDYTIGVPRSCTDVLKRPRGVCRDYATLFAGIARAAGIPTRLAGGITYAQGKFFYHAWVECWVGKWVPFDATLAQDFVDATHVKFSHGDVPEMYNVGSIVGRIKLTEVIAN